MTEYYYFDKDLHSQYRNVHPTVKGDFLESMGGLGECFFTERSRFLALDGMDEAHGSWGQFGTGISCKSWLSGGSQILNRRTWFAHMFRTQGEDFGFLYELQQSQIDHARSYSKDLLLNGKWSKAIHKLDWLVQRFAPVPTWG